MHLGSLLTALASFLDARSRAGEWQLRIDDLDTRRTRPGASDAILRSLESLGLHWEGPVRWQHGRGERYQAALDDLLEQGRVYACACSRRELASAGARGVYPGVCRDRRLTPRPGEHALRVVVDAVPIRFEDRVRGPFVQALERDVGDFIVRRRDGDFAYHLATVVDDADQGVTVVLRGQDLLDSTPRQIHLQRLLGLPTPDYAHTPLLLDAAGRKLSKSEWAPEALTRQPSRLLGQLLGWLRQPPPAELVGAPVAELLAWASAHWSLERLRGVGPIRLGPDPVPSVGDA